MAASEAGKPVKILVAGDVCGNLAALFKKVNGALKKAPFEALLCVGSFFPVDGSVPEGWAQYVSGELKVPISTYVLGPVNDAQVPLFSSVVTGGDLCENVFYVGPSGTFTMGSGLKLAFLSGRFDPALHDRADAPPARGYNTGAEVKALLGKTSKGNFDGIDILLTTEWAHGICNFARPPEGFDVAAIGSPAVSAVARSFRPRYHFAGLQPIFYERVPYRNHAPRTQPLNPTRFVGVAPVGNSHKQKWLYAFNICPRASMDGALLCKTTPDATECPYILSAPRNVVIAPPGQGFFFRDSQKRKFGGPHNPAAKMQRTTGPTGGACWFCLGSPNVEKHLVVSVGRKAYAAMAKGPLVESHVLVLPIQHVASSADLDEATRAEVAKYKESFSEFFKSRGQACVIFERNYRSQHLQLQIVPVAEGVADKVEAAFTAAAARINAEFKPVEQGFDFGKELSGEQPYFAVDLPDGRTLLHRITGERFPLQLGRQALASESVLNSPDRVHWKGCVQPVEAETAATKQFREAFKPFDFTKKK